ncbi:TIGR04063 family PEP-CTERM/XrtA system glycosyltransferase [Caenispirillum salinarum]|uniref:TIGR04063 family PEP-CTERM/XrtA system glycosyltransferase n=1 Tax=Caenispirillum salinarum TaxID=859058 RepID=UPI0038509590
MKILHVLDHSVPMHSGYSFRTLGILREQRARGWETCHLTSPKHTREGPAEEEAEGLVFHRTPMPPARGAGGWPLLREHALMRATEARLIDVVRKERPDILHAHSPALNAVPAVRVGRRFGLPVVYEIRAFWEDAAVSHGTARAGDWRYRLTRALESWAVRHATAVTTIAEGLRGDLLARGVPPGKVTVIPNAVDANAFRTSGRRDPGLEARLGLGGCVVLGFLGSFYGYEGLDGLLRALPDIARRRPEVRVLLVGGGPEDARLHALAADLGVADRVVFTGRVPHAEVQAYYDLVDVLVFPRARIRLTDLVTPLKPLEAMAMGKPVLASDVGGHRELIRDGATGWLFPPDDPAALAAAVDRVLADRDHWPAVLEAAHAYVEGERSWRAVVARYEGVYGPLVPPSRRRPKTAGPQPADVAAEA